MKDEKKFFLKNFNLCWIKFLYLNAFKCQLDVDFILSDQLQCSKINTYVKTKLLHSKIQN